MKKCFRALETGSVQYTLLDVCSRFQLTLSLICPYKSTTASIGTAAAISSCWVMLLDFMPQKLDKHKGG